ncbi:MAG: YjjG family noncanonical pyrimidine nucleotidase [Bacteroidetes bacterium]|nr:YjjG family noncanonical pyrimidine nucleotidase [Bacteroidota bacterium]
MSETSYRALFFDADDTIFDYQTAEREAFRITASAFGLADRLEQAHALYRRHNADVWRALERGDITQDDLKPERFRRLLSDLADDTGNAEAMSDHYLARLSEQTQLLPGAEAIVAAAARRYLLVLVTNGLTYVQRRRFAAAPVTRHFRKILISEEIGVAKPDPAIFAAALETYSLEPADVLLIGDSASSDMPAARNAGMDFCWVNPQGSPVPDGFTSRYVISGISELGSILQLETD